ncbi:DegT/DnrJ/EryC1/StrS aminotransferase family protein [Cryobacterium sp. Sr8]|uniref:DegT/DnrJ/EryC1/StrS family aminotransferase n=1 Tax=Cryobacterium sp. Sr8 TaxID=1259203 RepID=UPI0018E08DDC|nr:aminotransferase class V-fold PLP-dependent enzyme [Cryobacterium sp. Sr8]
MIPYGRQSIDDSDLAAVADVLRGEWLTTGPTVDRFEAAIADYVGARASIAVNSGTSALHVAYAAAEISPGDEVVTTPLTFVATAATAAMQGARIVFADIDETTGNLSLDAARAAVTSRTRAITAVDYAGVPVDGTAFMRLARESDALFIEDAAHAIGSTRDGRRVGEQADITTFSFFPTKNLTTAEGGAVVALDPDVELRGRRFRNHGLVRERDLLRWPDEGAWHQEVHSFGLNYRLPDVLAALGLSQLRRLGSFKLRRAEVRGLYDDAFSNVEGLRIPGCPTGAEPVWHLYPLRVPADRRREIFDKLRAAGIGVQVNYMPVYWHPVFEDLGYKRGLCPIAESYYRQEISLPMYAGLTDSQVAQVIEAVLKVVEK